MSKTLTVRSRKTYLDTLPGWDQLKPQEQELVRNESRGLGEDLYFLRRSVAGVGKRLVALRSVLEPKGMWGSFLQTGFGMSKSTAYNYINEYISVTELLSPVFVEIALRRGFILNSEVIKKNPPPKTEDGEEILSYLTKIQQKQPRLVKTDNRPAVMLQDCVRYVVARQRRLPQRLQGKFIPDLIRLLRSPAHGLESKTVHSARRAKIALVKKRRAA